MIARDVLAAIAPLDKFFRDQNIQYFVTGSVASTQHGVGRATMDVDLVVDLQSEHTDALVTQFKGSYYLDGDHIFDAVRCRGSFNMVHLESAFKIDLFMTESTEYQKAVLSRIIFTEEKFDGNLLKVPVCSREDIVLVKLAWFKAGDRAATKQFEDIKSVIKVNEKRLDHQYLEDWANKLGLEELLQEVRM